MNEGDRPRSYCNNSSHMITTPDVETADTYNQNSKRDHHSHTIQTSVPKSTYCRGFTIDEGLLAAEAATLQELPAAWW